MDEERKKNKKRRSIFLQIRCDLLSEKLPHHFDSFKNPRPERAAQDIEKETKIKQQQQQKKHQPEKGPHHKHNILINNIYTVENRHLCARC